jgi:hypothetical protein
MTVDRQTDLFKPAQLTTNLPSASAGSEPAHASRPRAGDGRRERKPTGSAAARGRPTATGHRPPSRFVRLRGWRPPNDLCGEPYDVWINPALVIEVRASDCNPGGSAIYYVRSNGATVVLEPPATVARRMARALGR